MGSSLVVISSPFGDHRRRVCEVVEVVIIGAFIAELTVETLDVGVLRRFIRRDQFQIHAAAVGPAVKRSTGEFGIPLGEANRVA